MKTYFKRPYEKSLTAVFYSSSDLSNELPARLNVRQRIVQPSTKEQQRLLSTSSPSRLQHVHSGKYGIRPLWPSDESSCAQWSHGRKPNKVRHMSITASSASYDIARGDSSRYHAVERGTTSMLSRQQLVTDLFRLFLRRAHSNRSPICQCRSSSSSRIHDE